MRLTRRRVAAAIGVVALVAGITFASAANVPLAAQTMTAAELTHPCPGTATALPAVPQGGDIYRGVTLTLPPGCANRRVQLTVVRPGNDRSGSGTTDANGEVTIDFGSGATYDEDDDNELVATVSGWTLPAEWWVDPSPYIWCTVIDASGAACAAMVTLDTRNGNPFYHVVVTTPSTSWVTWEVSFNLAHPFYGSVPTRLGNGDLDQYSDGAVSWAYNTANVNDVVRSSPCSAQTGELRVTGINSGTSPNVFNQVIDTRTRVFDLLVNVNQAGYFDVLSPGCM